MAKHLHSTDTPVNGDAPVWVTDHWEFKESVVKAENGLVGVGDTATPLRLNTELEWGEALAADGFWPDLDKYGLDVRAGQPVYVASDGFVRAAPQVLTGGAGSGWKPMSALPGEYPVGSTLMTLFANDTIAGGWPGTTSAMVITHRRVGELDSTACAYQYWHQISPTLPPKTMMRYGTPTGWSAWSDSGWVDVTIKAGFEPQTTNERPQVRLRNGVVYARGGWKKTGITDPAASYSVGIVPAGYRPTMSVVMRAGTDDGGNASYLSVSSAGDVLLRTGPTISGYFFFGGQSWLTD